MIGKRFNNSKLTVIKDSGRRENRKIVWECLCDCGNITYVTTNALNTGNTKSCGCGQEERYNMHTHNNLTFIDDTEVGLLNPNMKNKRNPSGYRGVSKKIIKMENIDHIFNLKRKCIG